MAKQEIERNSFGDSLKYLLMIFVVYGHMIETHVENSPFNQAMYNYIYIFHMPLFVFISGRFSHIRNSQRYLLRLLTIFETYIVFQFLRCSKSLWEGGHLSLFPDLLIPKGILWYLACLIIWRIMIYILKDLKDYLMERRKWFFLFISFVTGLGIGFIMVPNGAITRFFSLGPFFLMGYYLNVSRIESLFQRIPLLTTITLMISLWLLIYIYLNFDIRSVIYFESFYDNLPTSPFYYLGARIFLYAFAIIIGFALMSIVYSKPLLSSYGNYTLAIFMYHTIIIKTINPLFVNEIIPSNEILLFVISIAICFSLAWLTKKYKIMTIMLNPATYIMKKYIYNKK